MWCVTSACDLVCDQLHRLLSDERRKMLIALQFATAVAGQLANHRLWNATQEQNRRGHVAEVVNAQAFELFAGALARGLETIAHVPTVYGLSGEADVAAVGWEEVLIPSVAR